MSASDGVGKVDDSAKGPQRSESDGERHRELAVPRVDVTIGDAPLDALSSRADFKTAEFERFVELSCLDILEDSIRRLTICNDVGFELRDGVWLFDDEEAVVDDDEKTPCRQTDESVRVLMVGRIVIEIAENDV